MATNVVVIDSSFRRATIKVTPGKFLSEVLEEACEKLKLNASNYGLKNNNKPVNLSLPFRQTGLVAGAKLNLVVASKSPIPISVALQLPQSIAEGVPGGRLTDKFPSDTTLWLVLRKFESSTKANLNFTGRGFSKVDNGTSGAGRVFYEMPVLNVMGRELSSLSDLQRTLAGLGLSGNVLMRLTFKETDKPLEEAMEEIGAYFKEPEPEPAETSSYPEETRTAQAISSPTSNDTETTDTVTSDEVLQGTPTKTTEDATNLAAPIPDPIESTTSEEQNAVIGPDGKPIAVYRAPTSSVPLAALIPHNEADYEPTTADAKRHQSRLLERGQNKRLPSDAETEKLEQERAEKLAKNKEIRIKIRFADQSVVGATFDDTTTGSDLYEYTKGLMAAENEPFKLTHFKGHGAETVPRDGKKLIKDLGFQGGVMVNFVWGDDARESVRRVATLKDIYIRKAKDVPVPEILTQEPEVSASTTANGTEDGRGKGKEGDASKKKVDFSKFLRLSKK